MFLFETPRLRVRRMTSADVSALLAVYADPEVVRYVGDGQPISEADCRRWVEVTDENFERRGYGMVALEHRDHGEVVGFAGIVHPGGQPEAEVKYAFRRDAWGQGFATEALDALLAHAKRYWGVESVIATVDPANEPSQRVLGKLGFTLRADRTNPDGSQTRVFAR